MSKKISNYELVAAVLRNLDNYTKIEMIAFMAGIDINKTKASIKMAREMLAEQGIAIVNKMGSGYKVGSFDEHEIEATKACIRSFTHVKSIYNRSMMLKAAGVIGNFDKIKDIVGHNVDTIKFIVRTPDEFETPAQYTDYLEKLNVTSKWLSDVANETALR